MSRHICTTLALLLACLAAATGCRPTQPFYLTGRPGDMSYYLDRATELEFPDSDTVTLAEAEQATAPLTLTDPEPREMWDLTLEDAISTALQNSKVIRRAFHVTGGQFTTGVPSITGGVIPFQDGTTVYDPAIIETDPNIGVESALSTFDAQLGASLFWDKTDRPQNVTPVSPFIPSVSRADVANFQAQISKKTTSGATFFIRETTVHDVSNSFGAFRALGSTYTAAIETEWRQPLLQGRGTAVNRAPIVLARIRVDADLAELESNVRNLLKDTEDAYWTLMLRYRTLESTKFGRDQTLNVWRKTKASLDFGKSAQQDEAVAREQYYAFRAQVETGLRELYNAENLLRFLMGIAASDGRLIRPITEPTTAPVRFDWSEVSAEALVRVPELRRQKWVIKARETELIVAKNQLLPTFNATGLYRWVGLGDNLMGANRNGLNFPTPGSVAFQELTGGQYQESRFGAEFGMPIGFRKAMSGVRSTQLLIARERARLEDAELQVSHLLTQSVRNSDSWYQLMQTQFNRLVAAKTEENARAQLVGVTGEGLANVNFWLDSVRRVATDQAEYYNAVIEYNRSIADIHFRKGSLLEFNGVQMAEGPWPQKAYFDALGRARQRAASLYMNYGWTRPSVVSEGPVAQQTGGPGLEGAEGMPGDAYYPEAGEEIPPGRRDATPNGGSGTPTPIADPAVRFSPGAASGRSETATDFSGVAVRAPRRTSASPATVRPVSHTEAVPAPSRGWRTPRQ